MNGDLLLGVGLVIPVLTAALVVACRRWPNLRESVSIAGGVGLTACCVSLLQAVASGARPSLTLAEPLPGAALVLTLEPLGAVFATLASFLWILTTVYSIGYMRGHAESRQTRFFAWFAIALGAVFGAAAAGNLLTLFVFYELLTVSTWPLVTHAGTDAARRAGRLYLGLLIGSSIGLLLLAVLWTQVVAGSGDFVPGGLLAPHVAGGQVSATTATVMFAVFAFGIGKAALIPLHRWLPAAMVAPAPVSALLHAVAVVKTGVFALLKVAVYVFGLDSLQATGAGLPVAYVAGFTMLFASVVAITRKNLKERLAYSTVGQLGYIVAGTASATPEGVIGAGLHMVTHAFGKITLFFAAGAIVVAAHRTRVPAMAGLGRMLPFTFGAFLVAALSIVGVPPLAGTFSKWWLGAAFSSPPHTPLLWLLLVSSWLSAAYLLPVVVAAFGRRRTGTTAGAEPRIREAPITCLLAMGITGAGCVGLVFVLGPLQELIGGILR